MSRRITYPGNTTGSSGAALPPATQTGQTLFSVNGVTFTVQQPLVANSGGWMSSNLGVLLVVG